MITTALYIVNFILAVGFINTSFAQQFNASYLALGKVIITDNINVKTQVPGSPKGMPLAKGLTE